METEDRRWSSVRLHLVWTVLVVFSKEYIEVVQARCNRKLKGYCMSTNYGNENVIFDSADVHPSDIRGGTAAQRAPKATGCIYGSEPSTYTI